jgi:hypothetical protein
MESLLTGRLNTIDLHIRSVSLDIVDIIYLFTKEATLMRRSTVLSLSLQVVFPGFSMTEAAIR